MNAFRGYFLHAECIVCSFARLFAKIQRTDLFGLRVKLLPITNIFNHSKVEAIALSALPKDTISELADLS